MATGNAGDIDVIQRGFGVFDSGIGSMASEFDGKMQTVAKSSATAAGAGMMQEGQALMAAETESRNLLTQYMTKVSGGLKGYQGSVQQIGQHYAQLGELTATTMRKVMKPSDTPPSQDPMFDPGRVLAERQLTPPPAGGN